MSVPGSSDTPQHKPPAHAPIPTGPPPKPTDYGRPPGSLDEQDTRPGMRYACGGSAQEVCATCKSPIWCGPRKAESGGTVPVPSGTDVDSVKDWCRVCGGQGWVMVPGPEPHLPAQEPCQDCYGTGETQSGTPEHDTCDSEKVAGRAGYAETDSAALENAFRMLEGYGPVSGALADEARAVVAALVARLAASETRADQAEAEAARLLYERDETLTSNEWLGDRLKEADEARVAAELLYDNANDNFEWFKAWGEEQEARAVAAEVRADEAEDRRRLQSEQREYAVGRMRKAELRMRAAEVRAAAAENVVNAATALLQVIDDGPARYDAGEHSAACNDLQAALEELGGLASEPRSTDAETQR